MTTTRAITPNELPWGAASKKMPGARTPPPAPRPGPTERRA